MRTIRILLTAVCLLALTFTAYAGEKNKARKSNGMYYYKEPARAKGQSDVLQLTCPKLDTVRVGFIGVGSRGSGAVHRFRYLKGARIVAISDLSEKKVENMQNFLTKEGLPKPSGYSRAADEWKKLCERDDIDLVYICTDWTNHTPMAVYAMQHGKHVAIEVPAAMSIAECWDLVNTAEQTRRHCMMLENCCYDFFEMTTLNMAQQGMFGEIIHGEGAYIHELKKYMIDEANAKGSSWRLEWNKKYAGNLYPTHGLGPICQVMNIHRGDKMDYLVSVSTNQFGMTDYAEVKHGENSAVAKDTYKSGDMNTTIIKTAKGKTILVQHDITSPRPYSRLHTVSGTKGYAQKYPYERIALEPSEHEFMNDESMKKLMKEMEHPITKEIGEKAKEIGGHGGMDFIMDYRLVYCLQNGLPLDQDVYDAAEWSCLVELTELSVEHNGAPVQVPDFTRGAWNKIDGFKHAYVK